MKVKILKSIASPKYSYATGQEVELSKTQANEFIKAGVAVPLEPVKSTAPPTKETTSTRKGRNKDVDDS